MPVLKTKTVGGATYKLKQSKTNRRGKQYEYVVTENGAPVDDPVYTRSRGMDEFRETIQAVRRAEGEDRNKSRNKGMMGFEDVDPDFGDFTEEFDMGKDSEDKYDPFEW